MEIYLLLVFLLFLNAIIQKKISILLVFSLVLVAGLRSQFVGVDTVAYKELFEKGLRYLTLEEAIQKFEPIWILLNYTLYEANLGFQSLVVIASMLTVIPIYIVCKKRSYHPSLSILLYAMLFYYFLSFSLTRQFIAISFVLISFYYMVEKKNKVALLLFIVACLFHYSVIALLPLIYLSKKITFNKKYVFIVLTSTFLLGFIGFFKYFLIIFKYIPILKYANYVDYKADDVLNVLNLYLFLVPQNIMAYYVLKKTDTKEYFNFFLIGMVLTNLFLLFPVFARFVYYFLTFEILLIPNLLIGIKGTNKRQNIFMLILLYGLLYFVYYLFSNRGGIVPYTVFNFN